MTTPTHDFLADPEARILSIILSGRGTSGTLGALAQNRSIPADRYRRSVSNAPLRDAGTDVTTIDRAIEIRWLSDSEEPALDNPLQDTGQAVLRCEVTTGYVYGAANLNEMHLISSSSSGTTVTEDATFAAWNPERRAVRDGREIKRALECDALVRDGSGESSAVPLLDMLQESAIWQDIGGGRGIYVCTYRVRVEYSRATVFEPV